MFSLSSKPPAAATAPTRNPRRRQRAASGEAGASLPKAKRQRSLLNDDTFVRPQTEDASTENAPSSAENAESAAAVVREMPLRDKRNGGERHGTGDGSTVLSKNDILVVTKLPSLPDQLRNSPEERIHGNVATETSYALALTRTHAFVWPYTSSLASPETFVFTLPGPSKSPGDPLPVGSLVSPSAASADDPGLIVVMPHTGTIIYWESIASAATLDFVRQQRHGVEGSVGPLFAGETVIQLLNAEHAGFIICFSSGRLAYLGVRDNQGRPTVHTQFLRSNGPNVGLLGGLMNVLSGSGWRRDVAAVRAGNATSPGERDILAMTSQGMVQTWSINRGGHSSLLGEVDIKHDVILVINRLQRNTMPEFEESFEIIDFTIVPHHNIAAMAEYDHDEDAVSVVALAAMSNRASAFYSIVQLSINKTSAKVLSAYPVRTYSNATAPNAASKPRIFLPAPCHTAFIVFSRAVVVISISQTPETPDQQLLLESGRWFDTAEDVVDFRHGLNVEVVASGMEEIRTSDGAAIEAHRRRPKHPGVVLLIRGGGLIRIAANPPSSKPVVSTTPSVKSKIEQAIFFESVPHNILNFSGRAELQYDIDTIAEAACEISEEILTSSSPFIPAVFPSISHQLIYRQNVLQALAQHLKKTYPPISRRMKWKLMGKAERLAAALAIWQPNDITFTENLAKNRGALLRELFWLMNERNATQPDESKGEVDLTRHFFIKDTNRMATCIHWAYNAVLKLKPAGADEKMIMRFLGEANVIVRAALDAVYAFRKANVELYGLENENLDSEGFLLSGYEGLDEFWTGDSLMLLSVKKLIESSLKIAASSAAAKPQQPKDLPDPKHTQKIAGESGLLVNLLGRIYLEHHHWLVVQKDERSKLKAAAVMEEHIQVRKAQITLVAEIGHMYDAFALAEKFEDFEILVKLMADGLGAIKVKLNKPGLTIDETESLNAEFENLEQRADSYYDRFGDKWAHALYTYQMRTGDLVGLLNDHGEHQRLLTSFFRGKSTKLAKLAWINEILGEKDFLMASNFLLHVARKRETNIWSQKLEYSIGKLALLSRDEANPDAEVETRRLAIIRSELERISIQESLYHHVMLMCEDAIDQKAAIQLAMETYGRRLVKEFPRLYSLLEQGITMLLHHQAMNSGALVDVLSLMAPPPSPALEHPDCIVGQEFLLALKVVKLSSWIPAVQKLEQKVIWRRCIMRTNWVRINDTQMKDDALVIKETQATFLFKTLDAGHRIGKKVVLDFYNIFSILFLLTCLLQNFQGFWTDETKGFPPILPSEIVGACTTAKELNHRFSEDTDIQGPIALDIKKEDSFLLQYLKLGRLDTWFHAIMQGVKQAAVDREIKEKEYQKRRQEIVLEIELPDGHSTGDILKTTGPPLKQ
ncbi:MAG: hypothetical protein M1829_003741 [Trizodia sp. TS-e1964]|nr:MAG: hypothetical protein M1829_003741 [Trizodia sp. TS-e1964]